MPKHGDILPDDTTTFTLMCRYFGNANARYVDEPTVVSEKLPPIDRKIGEFELIDDVRNFAEGTTNYRLIELARNTGLLFFSIKGTQLWTRLYVPRLRLANHALVAQISKEMSSRDLRFLPLSALLEKMTYEEERIRLQVLPPPNFDFSIEDLDPEDQPAKDLVDWFLESMPAPSNANLVCFWQVRETEDYLVSSIRLWFFSTGVSASQTVGASKLKSAVAAKTPVAANGSSFMKDALMKKRKGV
jgi:hypothetical protein